MRGSSGTEPSRTAKGEEVSGDSSRAGAVEPRAVNIIPTLLIEFGQWQSLRPGNVTLRPPRLDEEQEFLRAHRATTPEVPNFLHYYCEGMPFARYILVLE